MTHLCPIYRHTNARHSHETKGMGFFHTFDAVPPEPTVQAHYTVSVDGDLKTTQLSDVAISEFADGWHNIEWIRAIMKDLQESGTLIVRKKKVSS